MTDEELQAMSREERVAFLEKQRRTLTRSMIVTLLVVIVAAAAVIARGSLAWFASNKEVNGGGSSVSVEVGTTLCIEPGVVAPENYIHTTSAVTTLTGNLKPISTSTCGASDWWYVTRWNNASKAYEYAAATPAHNDNDHPDRGNYTVTGILGGEEITETDTAYNLATYTVYVGGKESDVDVYLDPDVRISLTVPEATDTVDPKRLAETLRIGLVVDADRDGVVDSGELKFIYAPYPEDGLGNSVIAGDNVIDKFYAVTGTTTVTEQTGVLTNLSNYAAGHDPDNAEKYTAGNVKLCTTNKDGQVIRLYVWLEGTDAQALIGQSNDASGISIQCAFAGVEVTETVPET